MAKMARSILRVHGKGKKRKGKEEEQMKKEKTKENPGQKHKFPKRRNKARQTPLTKQERFKRVLTLKYENVKG